MKRRQKKTDDHPLPRAAAEYGGLVSPYMPATSATFYDCGGGWRGISVQAATTARTPPDTRKGRPPPPPCRSQLDLSPAQRGAKQTDSRYCSLHTASLTVVVATCGAVADTHVPAAAMTLNAHESDGRACTVVALAAATTNPLGICSKNLHAHTATARTREAKNGATGKHQIPATAPHQLPSPLDAAAASTIVPPPIGRGGKLRSHSKRKHGGCPLSCEVATGRAVAAPHIPDAAATFYAREGGGRGFAVEAATAISTPPKAPETLVSPPQRSCKPHHTPQHCRTEQRKARQRGCRAARVARNRRCRHR